MSPKDWEEILTNAYWDYRWTEIMEPLCDAFQRWKAGELGHADVDRAIDTAYKEKCIINSLLARRPDHAAAVIKWLDQEWFMEWIEEHRPPADARLSAGLEDAPD